MNVRLYFGAKMVTFCVIHMGNRKIFLKYHSSESQLILLHVMSSHILHYICKKLVGTRGGGMISNGSKCDVWVRQNISIWIFGVLSFFQYNEIISTSMIPFHYPLVMKYYKVFSILFFRL